MSSPSGVRGVAGVTCEKKAGTMTRECKTCRRDRPLGEYYLGEYTRICNQCSAIKALQERRKREQAERKAFVRYSAVL